MRACVRTCVRSFVRSFVLSCVPSFVRASLCSFLRALVRACVRACVRAFVRSFIHPPFLPFSRTEEVERNSQLRTRAMREAEKRPSKSYRFTLLRVRFPDGIILQGKYGCLIYSTLFDWSIDALGSILRIDLSLWYHRNVLFPRKTSGCVRVCSAVTRVRLAAVCLNWSHKTVNRWQRFSDRLGLGKYM